MLNSFNKLIGIQTDNKHDLRLIRHTAKDWRLFDGGKEKSQPS